MALAVKHWMRFVAGGRGGGGSTPFSPLLLHRLFPTRCYHPPIHEVKVGIPEFLKGVGSGVEAHIGKLETEIGDLQKLLVTRTLRLKKLGIPCKHRKLILRYTQKYRLGLWRPRADVQRQGALTWTSKVNNPFSTLSAPGLTGDISIWQNGFA